MKTIKTWRERLELPADFPLTCATAAERSMEEEIAELRGEQVEHLSRQQVADMIYRYTGLNQRQFPDEFNEVLRLCEALLTEANSSMWRPA